MSALIKAIDGSLSLNEAMGVIATQLKERKSITAQIELQLAELQSQLKAIRDDEEAVKGWFRDNMEVTGVTEISGPGIFVQAKTGAEAVEVDESALIAATGNKWLRIKHEVDKAGIKKALKAGDHVEGAKIVPGKLSITIKV